MENAALTRDPREKINWIGSIPFLTMHVLAIAGLFFFPVSWGAIALCIGMYYLRMFGITAGYHRYFAHRSYKTGRVFQFIVGFLGTLALQKGVLWWAALHRNHHKYSDMPQDLHSPRQKGFWWSHMGWFMSTKYDGMPKDVSMRDFDNAPEMWWLTRHYFLPNVMLVALLYVLGGGNAVFWGYIFSTVVLWHGTFTVNSLAHVWGKRRYETTDDSRNNLWIALITMGEGWHNNHHKFMSAARQGFFWWEIDMSYMVLKLLSVFGIVWDLRQPPERLLVGHDEGQEEGELIEAVS